MYNIVLLCQWGASTSMLSEKISKAAEEAGVDVVVNAYSFSDVARVIDQADVIMLGPQVRFKLDELKKEYGNRGVPIVLVKPTDYGLMNGKGILNTALEALKGE